MPQSDIASPLLPCLLGAMLLASTPTAAQTTVGADGPVSEFPATFFEPAQPCSAFDMIARLPGFTFYGGDQDVRGFSGASGNVLVDGERPTGRQETLEAILRRIPARSVVRIELIRPGAPGVDMQGAALLANVVRATEAVTRGRAEASSQVSSGGRLAPMLSLPAEMRSADRRLEGRGKRVVLGALRVGAPTLECDAPSCTARAAALGSLRTSRWSAFRRTLEPKSRASTSGSSETFE